MRTHAANPVAEWLHDDRFRISFSSRDAQNRSSIGFVEIDLRNPAVILRESDAPVLAPGDSGLFDDAGVSIGCIVSHGSGRLLYYMGWHLAADVPWRNAIGLAVSDNVDAPFVRVSASPNVPVDSFDPHTLSYPWVSVEDGRFRMWYGSSTEWGRDKGDMRHVIKDAVSDDGVQWRRTGAVAVGFDRPGETALSRPTVLRDADRHRMWFSARGTSYRIWEAESPDGRPWTRRSDAPALDVAPDGWDSEMVEYPCVFDHRGRRYMLYNGNGYGLTGFGLAVQEP
jgi:predicted GH43/DUF377 family glycosyl hydrolase